MAKMTFSDMYCTQCGHKGIPVQRNNGRERESGHLKKMFCLNCQKEVNMVEIRDFGSGYGLDDFLLEFEGKNFNEDGQRILPYKEFRQKELKNEKIC